VFKLSGCWSAESTTVPRSHSSRWHQFPATVVTQRPLFWSQPQAVRAVFLLGDGMAPGIQVNRGFKVQILAAISSHPTSHYYQGEPLIPVCGCGREIRSLGSPHETCEGWRGILVTRSGLFLLDLFLWPLPSTALPK